jgi:hypothetical protein
MYLEKDYDESWYRDLVALYPDEASGKRAVKEIEFAKLYAAKFNHGTDGHGRLNLIAKLAELLDHAQTGMYP